MTDQPSGSDLLPHPVYAIVAGGIRAIAASIPGCASLGQAWSEYESRRTTERIQELFTDLQAELAALQHTAAAKMASPKDCQDFPELVEMTVERVRREFDDAKRAKYARVLAKLLADSVARPHDDKVAMIDSLDSLTEADLSVLRLFEGKETCKAGDLEWKNLGLPGDPNEQLWQLACSLARLESRGLILKVFTHDGGVYVPRPLNKDTARWVETKYRVLPLGTSLIGVLFG